MAKLIIVLEDKVDGTVDITLHADQSAPDTPARGLAMLLLRAVPVGEEPPMEVIVPTH